MQTLYNSSYTCNKLTQITNIATKIYKNKNSKAITYIVHATIQLLNHYLSFVPSGAHFSRSTLSYLNPKQNEAIYLFFMFPSCMHLNQYGCMVFLFSLLYVSLPCLLSVLPLSVKKSK